MLFLPGSCERCSSVQLVASGDCIDGKALCGTCGGVVVSVAACAYPESDIYLFNALCAAIEKAALSPLESAQLAVALADTTTACGDREAFDMAVFWFPQLAPLRTALVSNLPRARQALAMLDTVLWERSKSRESGILRTDARRAAAE